MDPGPGPGPPRSGGRAERRTDGTHGPLRLYDIIRCYYFIIEDLFNYGFCMNYLFIYYTCLLIICIFNAYFYVNMILYYVLNYFYMIVYSMFYYGILVILLYV